MYETERLVLREWRQGDIASFSALNADPDVMALMARCLSPDETAAMVDDLITRFQANGFGFWAVEYKADSRFIGMIGLNRPKFAAPFTPCVEVGWRLHKEFWGRGLATEGAGKALDIGFDEYGLDEIVAFTTETNRRSMRVMEKLGMTRNVEDDFDHPQLDATHPLRRHVLYRLDRQNWSSWQG